MLIQKTYSGIGARKTPPEVMGLMTRIASFLESHGYILQSGGADGADTAFERGVLDSSMKKIFLPWKGFNSNTSILNNVCSRAMHLGKEFHPSWGTLSPAAQKLIARNSYQVMGEELDCPVDMVICYTPNGKAEGGTGQAIRIANHFKIPVFNLYSNRDIERIMSWMSSGIIYFYKDAELESWKLM